MRGRDIKRYGYEYADLWLINTHNGIKEKGIKPVAIESYPAIKKHLDKFYPALSGRSDKGQTPYNLRNCAYMEDFNRQKIVWIELADKGRFAFDDSDKFLTLNGTFILTGSNLEYLCCILNNPVTSWHFNTFCISSGVGTNQWRELYVRNLLIPNIPQEDQNKYLHKFNDIIQHERNSKSSVLIQNELNQMIFDLLGLNHEEIRLVESY